MAHLNYQGTHENVHTGLSGLNNDEKWKDMLNFRCSQGRTTVVPHKRKLLEAGCGFHTLIPAGKHNFAIGKCGSVGFVGADNFQTYRLWRLTQQFLRAHSGRGEQSQRLVVRGQYTGTQSRKLRVSYIDGAVVPYWAVPEPEAEPPTPPPIDYGCATAESVVALLIWVIDAFTDEPIDGAQVQMNRYGIVQYDEETNEDGRIYLAEVFNDTYAFLGMKDTYVNEEAIVTVNQEYNEVTIYLTPTVSFSELPCGVSFEYTSGVIEPAFSYYNKRLTWVRSETDPRQYRAELLLPDEGETVEGDVLFTFIADRVADAWVYTEETDSEAIVITVVDFTTDCSAWPVGEDGPEGEPTPEVIEVLINYYEYPPGEFETQETVALTGSIAVGSFFGTAVGSGTAGPSDLTLTWNVLIENWEFFFDNPTPATGTGTLVANYSLILGSSDREDPNGFYVEEGGAPFPNWAVTIPAP